MQNNTHDIPSNDPTVDYELLITTENTRVQADGNPDHNDTTALNATELFSIFTADIIREERLFTR
ncbi:MAG: hypothetical protein DI535_05035 [Citrobacter freundii]|nr:MAG: hypothetical protein DI535_05035 [Citrobacter freundii]